MIRNRTPFEELVELLRCTPRSERIGLVGLHQGVLMEGEELALAAHPVHPNQKFHASAEAEAAQYRLDFIGHLLCQASGKEIRKEYSVILGSLLTMTVTGTEGKPA